MLEGQGAHCCIAHKKQGRRGGETSERNWGKKNSEMNTEVSTKPPATLMDSVKGWNIQVESQIKYYVIETCRLICAYQFPVSSFSDGLHHALSFKFRV